MDYVESATFEEVGPGGEWSERFCENSLVVLNEGEKVTAFIPAYVRCHFRNMTEMDIQNLSCRFVATMNISFHLGTPRSTQPPTQSPTPRNAHGQSSSQR
jgi:hypothetical protein